MGLKEIVKKEYIENDSTLCFKTTPLSKIFILSFLSDGYDIILTYNYWKAIKHNFGYNISPFWRGLFEIFTNFKLFPFFSKYFECFNIKLCGAIWYAILYLVCFSSISFDKNELSLTWFGINLLDFNLKIHNVNYIKIIAFGIICLVFIADLGRALIFTGIQNKINKINEQYYPNAPKNNWSAANIIWIVIFLLFLLKYLISFYFDLNKLINS